MLIPSKNPSRLDVGFPEVVVQSCGLQTLVFHNHGHLGILGMR